MLENNKPVRKQIPHQMNKGSDRKGEVRNIGRGWDRGRREYRCADGADARVPSGVFKTVGQEDESDSSSWEESVEEHVAGILAPVSGIWYRPSNKDNSCRLFVSETEFDRGMSQVVGGLRGKTIIFPRTCREALRFAFERTSLRSVVLNERLEVLENAFYGCNNLVTLSVGVGLTHIYSGAFYGCNKLETVNYGGDADAFAAIRVDNGNEKFTDANAVYGT